MRRAMLTNRPVGGGAPFTVGYGAIDRTISSPIDILVPLANPAPRAGTLTQASFFLTVGGTVRAFTGTWDGTTFSVTDATGDLTGNVGLNTYSVNLAIPSGGYVGFYGVGTSLDEDSSGGSVITITTAASAPIAGATYTGFAARTWLASVEGTGS